MGLRRHLDREGRVWNVWDVPARFTPKRSGVDRRLTAAPTPAQDRRTGGKRRVTIPPPEWVHGWVCFEADQEKRRLCPLPDGWETATAEELEEYRQKAIPVNHK